MKKKITTPTSVGMEGNPIMHGNGGKPTVVHFISTANKVLSIAHDEYQ
jgi:hypothetical protein